MIEIVANVRGKVKKLLQFVIYLKICSTYVVHQVSGAVQAASRLGSGSAKMIGFLRLRFKLHKSVF
jgi:hypothetical protein